jgi:hypothetical protein
VQIATPFPFKAYNFHMASLFSFLLLYSTGYAGIHDNDRLVAGKAVKKFYEIIEKCYLHDIWHLIKEWVEYLINK